MTEAPQPAVSVEREPVTGLPTEMALREQVAKALFNKARLSEGSHWEEAIAAYDDLLARFD